MNPVPYSKDLCLGDLYKLTEFVEGQEVSTGDFFLVSLENCSEEIPSMDYSSEEPKETVETIYYPVLGFTKIKTDPAHIFLREGQVAWGDRAWRRTFHVNNYWEMYWPAGGKTWYFSSVKIEKVV